MPVTRLIWKNFDEVELNISNLLYLKKVGGFCIKKTIKRRRTELEKMEQTWHPGRTDLSFQIRQPGAGLKYLLIILLPYPGHARD